MDLIAPSAHVAQHLFAANERWAALAERGVSEVFRVAAGGVKAEDDERFVNFVRRFNEGFAREQIKHLKRIHLFMRNKSALSGSSHFDRDLTDDRQESVKSQCLTNWGLPTFAQPLEEDPSANALFARFARAEWRLLDGAAVGAPLSTAAIAGPKPLLRCVEDWVAVPLGRGDRVFVVGLNKNRTYIFNSTTREWRDFGVSVFGGTVAEGELAFNPDGARTLYLFDALAIGGEAVAHRSFAVRAELTRMLVRVISKAAPEPHVTRVAFTPCVRLGALPKFLGELPQADGRHVLAQGRSPRLMEGVLVFPTEMGGGEGRQDVPFGASVRSRFVARVGAVGAASVRDLVEFLRTWREGESEAKRAKR